MNHDDPNDSVVSFLGNSSPSLSLRHEDGSVQGWPMQYVATWLLSSDGRSLDILVVDADPPTRLELRGQGLAEVTDALASGSGGTVIVQGVRYLPLATPGRAYVVSAQAKRAWLSDE